MLSWKESYPIGEIIAILVIIGLIFTSVAYFLTKSFTPFFLDRKRQKNEVIIVVSFVIYLVLFLTYYKELISIVDTLLPISNSLTEEIVKGLLKLIFLVLIPITVYGYLYGFTLPEWGIIASPKKIFSGKSVIIFLVFAGIIIPFQYFVGNGAKPIREGMFDANQILVGIPFAYLWLVITVGIVEEFFFRTFLQSRLSAILKSDIGAIILSAVIFGLAHAPGLYLRGAGEIANLGTEPSLLVSIGYSFLVLSVAGFFLSVIWLKTKNFWLIVAIHALVDLLPGLPEFINLWGIK